MTPEGPLLFAHVPKCAGTSVAAYLAANFGPLAFHDPQFNQVPTSARWTRTSPQHADAMSLNRLFPPGFLRASFALVRHPVARLVSVFRFQRDIERRIPSEMPFDEWLEGLARMRRRKWAFDNHVRPMSEMVPETAVVFRLEDGWDPVIDWLQGFCPAGTVLPRRMPERNVLERRLAHEGRKGSSVMPSANEVQIIAQLFREDFRRFFYDYRQENE